MLHNRFPRFNPNKKNRNRNLDNLHVIPTVSAGPKTSNPNVPSCSTAQKFYMQRKEKKKLNKRQRQRKREIKHLSAVQPIKESPYHWFNPGYLNDVETPSEEKVEFAECSPEAPVEESYFEEVEVASYETEGAREIPVGFRKSKIQYLRYKRNCFFRPKIYKFGTQRIIVNCLNIQNNSTDIDVVSEAEYELDCETDKSDKYASQEELHTILEENKTHEPKTIKQIGDGLCSKEKADNSLCSEEKAESNLCIDEKNIIKKSDTRNYKRIIKNEELGLYQDKSLDQKSLDSWKSHLIGLEYLLEIQDENKVMKYHCVLCSDDLAVEGFPSICVINHVNGYKHMVKYLEKHFPACTYRFSETSNHDNNIILQKLCDVISRNLGYSFMCITKLDQYMNNKQKIVDIILNAYNFNEDSLKLDDELSKTVDSILLDEVTGVLNNIIEQIAPSDTVNSEALAVESISKKLVKQLHSEACLKNDDGQSNSKCSELSNDKKSLDISNPSSRVKRSKSLASYLKLTHATARFEKSKAASANKKRSQAKGTPSENIVSEQKKDNVASNLRSDNAAPNQRKDSSSSSDSVILISEIKKDSNNISEFKILKHDEPSTVKTEEDKSEVTMTVKNQGAKISRVSKISKVIKPNARQKLVYKIREKALQKQTAHSKHCPKRILSKGNSRLRMTVKTREGVGDVIDNTSVQCQSVIPHSASERVVNEKKKNNNLEELKRLSSKTTGSSHKLESPLRKVSSVPLEELKRLSRKTTGSSHKLESPLRKVSSVPLHKVTKIVSKSSNKVHNIENVSIHPKIVHKYSENSKSSANVEVRDLQSHKKVTKVSRSPKHSESPIQRIIRRHSRSPVRRIKSPLRVVRSPIRKSPIRRHSRSPIRKIKSPLRIVRSPARKKASPVRRHSRSPMRRRSRSPLRRLTRSPIRRRSRSPIKRRSRSPLRRQSRSPIRRQSRSPIRRYSRSPVRRISRSPVRRYSRNSRSPVRRHSKSPFRRHSRSPGYRKSRSPRRRHSRTPLKHHSRSPVRRYSRSPVRRRSRSPVKRHSRSPHFSPVKISKNSYRGYSPVHDSRSFQGSNSHDKFSSPHKHFSTHDLSLNIKGSVPKNEKYHKSYPHGPNRDISDLDPVSDEDESVYFNTSDKRQHTEDPKMSVSSRAMVAQLLQKFSLNDANANDPTLRKLMQFLESHSDELQDLMSSQPGSDKRNLLKVDANVHDRNAILQQYLLLNLAGNVQEPQASNVPFPVTPNVPPNFSGPPFVQDRACVPPYGLPPHGAMQDHPQSLHNQQRYFPPNLNVPPPEHSFLNNQFTHPPQRLSPNPKIPQENMFKDLKATVSKLFGANENSVKQEKIKPNLPTYVTEPDPEKWDLSHPNAPKFNMPVGSKEIFHSQGKNLDFHSIPGGSGMRSNMPMPYKNNSGPVHFFNRGIDRPQHPSVPIPPPDTKVAFCDGPSTSSKGNLFPVVNNMQGNLPTNAPGNVSDVKVSLAQRLASVLVKVGMIDVPAPLLQEMLMKIGAFSSSPPQDIRETEIVSILKRLGYLS